MKPLKIISINTVNSQKEQNKELFFTQEKTYKLCSSTHYDTLRKEYPNQDWNFGQLEEDLTVDNLQESDIRIGDIFELGLAIIQITQPASLSDKLELATTETIISKKFSGVYAKVIREGKVTTGATMHLIARNPENMSVAEIFDLINNKSSHIDKIQLALNTPELSDDCKNELRKKL